MQDNPKNYDIEELAVNESEVIEEVIQSPTALFN